MSKDKRERNPVRPWMVMAGLAFFSVILIVFGPSAPPPSPPPKPVEAPAFVWPADCAEKDYKLYDVVSKACVTEGNRISDEFIDQKGLSTKEGRGVTVVYYRLSNDAVFIKCPKLFSGPCRIRRVYKNIFVSGG